MGPSLLIVDDEANFLILLDRILSREGYQVMVARGADRALPHINLETFDLAILDINMYPMNGVELLAKVKMLSSSTQVVMVTGYPTDHTGEECMKLGAADYLIKPIKMAELKGLLRQLTGTQELIRRPSVPETS